MNNNTSGAGAVPVERAAECRQHQQILFEGGLEVKVNRVTGCKTLEAPPRRRPEIPAKYSVSGLKVFFYDAELRFEWIVNECIDESDAIDAQCRAGWPDVGYGFYGLQIGVLPDGSHRARWSCGTVCE